MERERRRAHRQKQISEAQAIIEGADMDGLVPCVVTNYDCISQINIVSIIIVCLC